MQWHLKTFGLYKHSVFLPRCCCKQFHTPNVSLVRFSFLDFLHWRPSILPRKSHHAMLIGLLTTLTEGRWSLFYKFMKTYFERWARRGILGLPTFTTNQCHCYRETNSRLGARVGQPSWKDNQFWLASLHRAWVHINKFGRLPGLLWWVWNWGAKFAPKFWARSAIGVTSWNYVVFHTHYLDIFGTLVTDILSGGSSQTDKNNEGQKWARSAI